MGAHFTNPSLPVVKKLIFMFVRALLLNVKEPLSPSLCCFYPLGVFRCQHWLFELKASSQCETLPRYRCQPINLVDSFLPLPFEWRKQHLHLQRYWISKLQFLQPTNLSPPILLWGRPAVSGSGALKSMSRLLRVVGVDSGGFLGECGRSWVCLLCTLHVPRHRVGFMMNTLHLLQVLVFATAFLASIPSRINC